MARPIAGRCALRAGPQAAVLRPQPHPGGAGVHHLLRGGEAGGSGGRQGVSYPRWEAGIAVYLHLGQSVVIPDRDILGIFDLDNASWAFKTRELLERAEEEGRTIWLTEDLPRSFILADSRWGEPVVYISPLSSATLAHRAEQGGLE